MSEQNDLTRTSSSASIPAPAGTPARPTTEVLAQNVSALPVATPPEDEARERLAALEREARALVPAIRRPPPCSSTRSACSGRRRSRTRATRPSPSRTPTSWRRASSRTSAPRAASSRTWATGRWSSSCSTRSWRGTEEPRQKATLLFEKATILEERLVARGGRQGRLAAVPGAEAHRGRPAHPARGPLRGAQRLRVAGRGVPAARRHAGAPRRCARTTSPPRAWCSRSASSSARPPPTSSARPSRSTARTCCCSRP